MSRTSDEGRGGKIETKKWRKIEDARKDKEEETGQGIRSLKEEKEYVMQWEKICYQLRRVDGTDSEAGERPLTLRGNSRSPA